MNLEEAFYTLEFKSYEISRMNMNNLKKKYHRMALLHHPDKNDNSIVSKEKFQKINEAFEVIKKELSLNEDEFFDENTNYSNNCSGEKMYKTENSRSENSTNINYSELLKLFFRNVVSNEKVGEFVSKILQDLIIGCKDVSLKMFQDLDKDKCIFVYDFMLKYKTTLHLKDELIEKVKEIILEKYKNVEMILLNPSIDDLLGHNIYKLCHKEKVYYVPLWHHELYYEDDFGKEIIVKCIPELPENAEIDEYNNLFIKVDVPFHLQLIEEKCITVSLGKFNYNISLEELKMKKIQSYTIKKCGISRIQENDMYNIDKLSDIVLKITFL